MPRSKRSGQWEERNRRRKALRLLDALAEGPPVRALPSNQKLVDLAKERGINEPSAQTCEMVRCLVERELLVRVSVLRRTIAG